MFAGNPEGLLFQYTCSKCGYHREGLLDDEAYSTHCPQCGDEYRHEPLPGLTAFMAKRRGGHSELLQSAAELGLAFAKEQQDRFAREAIFAHFYMALPWWVRARCAIRHFFRGLFCKPKHFKFEVEYIFGKNALKEYYKDLKNTNP